MRTAQLAVKIVSDAKNAAAGFAETHGWTQKLAGGFKVAAVAALGLATAAAAGLADAIGKAGQLEQSTGAVEAVFKHTSDAIQVAAAEAADSVGLSTNAYQELATVLGAQLRNGGTALDQLAPKTQNLIALGADMSSMFGGTTKDAVAALSSALKGERDPIEKYGVTLKQSMIDAEAAALGYQKVGGALSAQATQAATLSLIYKQTSDAAGNFGRETITLAHQQQVFGATMENLSTQVGTAFLPLATEIATAAAKMAGDLGPKLVPILEQVGAFLGSAGTQSAPFLAALKGIAAQVVPVVLPALVQLWLATQQLGAQLAPVAVLIASQLGPTMATVVPVVVQLVAHVVAFAATIATALTPAVAYIATNVMPAARQAFETIAPPVMDVIDAVGGLVAALITVLMPAFRQMMTVTTTVWGVLAPFVGGVLSTIAGLVRTITAAINGDWSAAWQQLKATAQNLWNSITGTFKAGLDAARNMAGGAANIGQNMVDGLVGGIKAAASRAVDAAKAMVSDALQAAKKLLGINSPSRAWYDVGWFSGMGALKAFQDITPKVQAAAAGMVALPASSSRLSPAAQSAAGAGGATIIVQGALDPVAVAAQLRSILNGDAIRRGTVQLGSMGMA